MAGLREEGGAERNWIGEDRWSMGGKGGSDQASLYDGWRMFKGGKKQLMVAWLQCKGIKGRERLNKKIHHWGKGIRLIEGPVKERDNLRGVKVKIW